MIKIEAVSICGLKEAIRGMRNPMNSWNKSDSGFCAYADRTPNCWKCQYIDTCRFEDADRYMSYIVGPNDHELAMKLAAGGPVHAKYRRMITVYLDITAPLYWWKEFDTYKVGTVANSCSTMHKIQAKEFTLKDFSCEHLIYDTDDQLKQYYHYLNALDHTICALNSARDHYIETKDKKYWWQMIQLLPSSYNQKRTVMLNYEVLAGIYPMRKDHKLDEWQEFCKWIEQLPYSEFILGKAKDDRYPEWRTRYLGDPARGKEDE